MTATETIKKSIAGLNEQIANGSADADFLREWIADLESLLPFINDDISLAMNKYTAPKAAGRPELSRMSIWMA